MSISTILPAEPFRANQFLTEKQAKAYSTAEISFEKALLALRAHFINKFGTNGEDSYESDISYLSRKKAAIIGEPAAKDSFIQDIQEFLRENPEYQATKYPKYYPNLKEALFQHYIGFGPMSVWFDSPTESAMVNGTQILFGVPGKNTKELQPFSYDSIEQVEKLIRSLTLKDPTQQVNESENWTQVDMLNGTRVTIYTPPLSETYVLIFRQYPFNKYTFEHEAESGTIPVYSVKWFKLLSKLMLSVLATGFRGSGKTSFIKTIAGARDPYITILTAETGTFEAHLRRDFPERAPYIIALKASLEEQNSLFPAFVRSDAHYMMIPEIRSGEVDLAFQSKEKGNGWLGSYHSEYVLNIPLEFADLSLETRANRSHRSTYIRAAQSLDLVIPMWEDKTGRKIANGVYAYEYDHESESFTVTTWMKYHRKTDSWTFNAQMPPQMTEKLENREPELLEQFMNEFKRLQEKHPFEGRAVKTVRIGG